MPIPPSPAKIGVRNAGSLVGKRGNINITTQSGITITPTDDAANDEVELAFTLPAAVGVLVYHNTTQSISDDTDTTLVFNSETYDTNAFHDTGSNTSRLTVPSNYSGTYEVFYAVTFAADADGYRQVTLLKNGSPVAGFDHRLPATPTLATALAGSFPPVALVATDYLELRVRHTAGAATNVATNSAFGMMMVQGSVAAASGTAPDSADYWVETANGGLSAEVVVGTTGITTAAYASRQAAAKAGRLFLPSDGAVIERDTGAAWAPWGPMFRLTAPPAVASLTWDNQGSATASETAGGFFLAPAATSTNVNALYVTAPSPPYSWVIGFIPAMLGNATVPIIGAGFRASGTGKLALLNLQQTASSMVLATSSIWTTSTSFSANYGTGIGFAPMGPMIFFKIQDDNANRILSIGSDPSHFVVVHTVTRTDQMTPDQLVVAAGRGGAGAGVGMWVLHWATA